jgi:hypothetical protein
METLQQKTVRVTTNINWFIFGAVALSVGLFLITGAFGWAVTGFVASYLFGIGTVTVLGAKTIVEKENT